MPLWGLVGLGAVGLFLLATASTNVALFAEHYRGLLILNGTIAAILAILVIRQLVMLRRRLKAGSLRRQADAAAVAAAVADGGGARRIAVWHVDAVHGQEHRVVV